MGVAVGGAPALGRRCSSIVVSTINIIRCDPHPCLGDGADRAVHKAKVYHPGVAAAEGRPSGGVPHVPAPPQRTRPPTNHTRNTPARAPPRPPLLPTPH